MFNIAVFVSGHGSTLENLLDYIENNKLDINVNCVVSSSNTANAVKIAVKRKVPNVCSVNRNTFKSDAAFNDTLWNCIKSMKIDLIVLAGFFCKLSVPNGYENKIINLHPSLLPDFSGKGMYGDKVFEAILDAKVSTTGITIHLVDDYYDNGDIIYQEKLEVLPSDDIFSLKKRVQELERKVYPKVIQDIAEGKIKLLLKYEGYN